MRHIAWLVLTSSIDLAFVVGIAGGPAWGQSKNQKDKGREPSATKRTDPQPDQRGTKDAPFFVYIEQSPHPQANAAPTGKGDADSNWYDKLSAWSALYAAIFTGALVLIGGGGVCAALKTLKAIKRQADLQERSIRPWIGTDFIADGTITGVGDQLQVRAAVSLKNTGPSVALEGLMLPFLISSRTSELPSGIKDAWSKTRGVLANRNKTEWETGFVLHPTRSHTHECVMGTAMRFNELQAGMCFVLICVIYRDQFGKEHTTQDCFWVRLNGTDPVTFDAVPAHQKAD
jgi:hypothetical protein